MSQERPGMVHDMILDSGVDTTISTPVLVPRWARYASLYIPNITDGTVGFQMMENKNATAATLLPNADTNWIAIRDEGESAQVAASGVESCWIDCSEFIKSLPPDCWIRVIQGAAEAGGAALTYRVAFRGA
jgi:hypothetical protein